MTVAEGTEIYQRALHSTWLPTAGRARPSAAAVSECHPTSYSLIVKERRTFLYRGGAWQPRQPHDPATGGRPHVALLRAMGVPNITCCVLDPKRFQLDLFMKR